MERPSTDQRLVKISETFGPIERILPYPRLHTQWPTRFSNISFDPVKKVAHLDTLTTHLDLMRVGTQFITKDIEKASASLTNPPTIRVRFTNGEDAIDYILSDIREFKGEIFSEFAKIEILKRFKTHDVVYGIVLYKGGILTSAFLGESMPIEENVDYIQSLNSRLNPKNKSRRVLHSFPGMTLDKEGDIMTVEYRGLYADIYYSDIVGDFTFNAGKHSFAVKITPELTTLKRTDSSLPWSIGFQNRIDTSRVYRLMNQDVSKLLLLPSVFNTQINISNS